MLASLFLVDHSRAQVDDALTLGRDTYDEFCGACHGYDGKPLLPGTPAFVNGERLEQSDTVLLKSIRDGKGDLMPSWGDVLTEDERIAILAYVRIIAAEAASAGN